MSPGFSQVSQPREEKYIQDPKENGNEISGLRSPLGHPRDLGFLEDFLSCIFSGIGIEHLAKIPGDRKKAK